jgi:hypothetical protein
VVAEVSRGILRGLYGACVDHGHLLQCSPRHKAIGNKQQKQQKNNKKKTWFWHGAISITITILLPTRPFLQFTSGCALQRHCLTLVFTHTSLELYMPTVTAEREQKKMKEKAKKSDREVKSLTFWVRFFNSHKLSEIDRVPGPKCAQRA